MAGPALILRELHRLRRHARDLQAEIDRIPLMLRAQQARAARQEEALREAQDTIKRLKMTSHDREKARLAALQQITKHERQLNEATSKKEYDALKLEIAEENKRCSQLEDEILEALTQIEERTAELPQAEKALAQARAEYANFEKNVASRRAGLAEQLEQVHRELAQVEGSLPEDVRPQYQRLVTARGDDAMAAVQNRTCMACYTEITAQAYNNLMLGHFVFCKNCGRALYLPE